MLPVVGRCTDVQLVTPAGPLVDEIDLGAVSVSAAISNGCELRIKVVRGATVSPVQPPSTSVLLAIGLEDGMGDALNTLLVPLNVKLESGPAASVTLTLIGEFANAGDLLTCLQLP